TQAPAQTPPSGFTGGALDDRFDFQVSTGELFNGSGLEYLSGSYHTFGNNGSVAVNHDINDPSSTALAQFAGFSGPLNRINLLNLLTTVTDHLPVVADYTVPLVNNVTPTVQFAAATQTVDESAGSVAITVQLSAASTQDI